MQTSEQLAAIRRRAEHCREAVATFVRIQEELLAMRNAASAGAARERVEAMIKLNRDTMDAVKRSLAIAEAEHQRAEGALARNRPRARPPGST